MESNKHSPSDDIGDRESPRVPWFLRSRWRLFSVSFVVLVLVLGTPALLIATQVRQSLHARSVQESARAAQLAARMVDAHFDGLRRYVESFGRRPLLLGAVARRDDDRVRDYLEEIVRNNPHFDRAFVTDTSGVLWADYPPVRAVWGKSFAARDWFRGVSQRQATYLSGIYQRAAAPPSYLLAVAIPLKDDRGRSIGYLVGQHTVDTLVRWLSQLESAGTASLSLIDQYGVLTAASTDIKGKTPPVLAQHPLVIEALRGGSGSRETSDPITDRPAFVSYAAVAATGWVVLAREPIDVMHAPIAAFRRNIFGMTALFIAGALGLGYMALSTVQRYHRALGESEARFRGFLDSAPDAVVISHPDGRIAVVNAQAEQLFGYRRDEMIGQAIELLIPERFRARHHGHREGYVADPRTRTMGAALELYARRKDGSEFPVGISLSPIHTKDGTLIFSDIRDATWRKQAERELRASEERFRALAETANDAIVSANSRGDIIYFNNAAERIFGYTVAEVVGRPVTSLMPERFHAAHRVGLGRLAGGGASRVVGKTTELVGRRKDGEEFSVELSLASWKVGDELYFTGMLRDITRRKQAEQRIIELNSGLERRATELETLNKELEAFSYSVSHDLRAPLRSIDGFSQALLEDYPDRLDATGQNYLQRVRAAAQRMGHLIDDLLKLSRVSRTELNTEDVDLTTLAREVADELRRQEPARAVRVEIVDGLMAHADPRLARVALENLIGNAWKFTQHRADARIEFGAERRDGQTIYYVRDNGAGFDMAYAGKLFGAFQRLHDAREFPGTGVGLATVQRVIHKHGGRIWAEGAVDRGATFYFTL